MFARSLANIPRNDGGENGEGSGLLRRRLLATTEGGIWIASSCLLARSQTFLVTTEGETEEEMEGERWGVNCFFEDLENPLDSRCRSSQRRRGAVKGKIIRSELLCFYARKKQINVSILEKVF